MSNYYAEGAMLSSRRIENIMRNSGFYDVVKPVLKAHSSLEEDLLEEFDFEDELQNIEMFKDEFVGQVEASKQEKAAAAERKRKQWAARAPIERTFSYVEGLPCVTARLNEVAVGIVVEEGQ